MSEQVLVIPSIANTDPEELRTLRAKTARERKWYRGYKSYATNADILAAHINGRLSKVEADDNVAPIGRLRNPELIQHFPPYLLPHSLVALRAIGGLWRTELQARGDDIPQARLAVTSVSRSSKMQVELVNSGKLAERESTHPFAAAFDLDGSGYYIEHPEYGLVPVVHPDRPRQAMALAADKLKQTVSQPYQTPEIDVVYNPNVIEALQAVTDRLHDLGMINRILEFAGTPNQCLHIAPNPNASFGNIGS